MRKRAKTKGKVKKMLAIKVKDGEIVGTMPGKMAVGSVTGKEMEIGSRKDGPVTDGETRAGKAADGWTPIRNRKRKRTIGKLS